MPDLPSFRSDGAYYSAQGVQSTGNAEGVLLTNSGVAHTKGDWTDIGTIPFDCQGFIWSLTQNTGGQFVLTDLSGDGGSSTIVENLYTGNGNALSPAPTYYPIALKGGNTFSARYQASLTSWIIRGCVNYVGGGLAALPPASLLRTHGANTSTSHGTTVLPNLTPGVYGTAISFGTTTEAYRAFLLGIGANGLNNHIDTYHFITIMADGTEIMKDLVSQVHTGNDHPSEPIIGPFPCHIPAGAEITIKQRRADSGSSTLAALDFAFYGVPYA